MRVDAAQGPGHRIPHQPLAPQNLAPCILHGSLATPLASWRRHDAQVQRASASLLRRVWYLAMHAHTAAAPQALRLHTTATVRRTCTLPTTSRRVRGVLVVSAGASQVSGCG